MTVGKIQSNALPNALEYYKTNFTDPEAREKAVIGDIDSGALQLPREAMTRLGIELFGWTPQHAEMLNPDPNVQLKNRLLDIFSNSAAVRQWRSRESTSVAKKEGRAVHPAAEELQKRELTFDRQLSATTVGAKSIIKEISEELTC